MDGKHIVMQAPANSGSYYYNYKGTFSTVLLAVVDAEYKFMYVDVGCNGRVSDGGVFNTCSLYEALESGTTKLPPAIPLPGQTQPVPHFFVADDAFAVRHYIMKPYPFKDQPAPNRIFNYRLSRARRIVENVFGVIANRFLVLRKPIIQNPQSTVNIVLAVCVLHNFLMSTQASWSSYLQPRLLDTENTDSHEVQSGTWREEGMPATNLLQLQRRPHPSSQNNTRDEFRAFFMSPQGEITWQYKHT
ncbi:hypothetical protein Cfor_11327 [Coptotermes formosanus]|uniref:DDE Tnp4 domain-containing protein n=1 Tax=Coptotermes formosanus TaxID=36987 RepID=A0A6L2PAY8_COPFO|nr:hypothetical protein Cfor_11327 [Coptotermes formosanus]